MIYYFKYYYPDPNSYYYYFIKDMFPVVFYSRPASRYSFYGKYGQFLYQV